MLWEQEQLCDTSGRLFRDGTAHQSHHLNPAPQAVGCCLPVPSTALKQAGRQPAFWNWDTCTGEMQKRFITKL